MSFDASRRLREKAHQIIPGGAHTYAKGDDQYPDEMVKFAKDGSDVTSAAVKLARAYTGRDMVATCAEHAFFAVDDGFIGSTPMSSLQQVIDVCHARGAVFVLDEMITGFRWHLGGAQAHYGIRPDLSAFGKGIANGFSVSAPAGRRDIMELGGLRDPRPRVFLLSTTHSAETHGLAAALATISVYQKEGVIEHLRKVGEALRAGINRAAAEAGVAEMIKHGFLTPSLDHRVPHSGTEITSKEGRSVCGRPRR